MGLATPSAGQLGSMTPEQMQAWRWEKELDERNRPLSDEELDALFPQEGYKVGVASYARVEDHCLLYACGCVACVGYTRLNILLHSSADSEATCGLPAHPHSSPQADCHTHSHGHEWVPVPDGGQSGNTFLALWKE